MRKENNMKLPLFRTVYFNNIFSSSKKQATVSVRLTRSKEDLFYVKKAQSSTEVIGYKDPDTSLFMTKLRSDDTKSNLTHNMFRDLAWRYAEKEVTQKLKELKEIYDVNEDEYHKIYKPIAKIEQELSEYLLDKHDFFVDLDKQIAVVKSNLRPHVNEYLLFKDDKINDDMFATIRLNYKNPQHQTLDDEQRELVDTFLNVFVDKYNKRVLSWYFGAMLCNLPIYDERISKLLIVSSARGGSGKNTLINSLTNALLTDAFREIKSSFDTFFLLNNRFGSSQILPLRLIQYSEAEFNDVPHGTHNFDGLNISELKSMISEGYIASEKKYADMQTTRLSSLQVVLTNNPPVIDKDREALNRRLLALIVNPSRMSEKGEQLGMTSEQKIYEFVEDNVQAFANYFVSIFHENEYAFTQLDYNHDETVNDIVEGDKKHATEMDLDNASLKELQHNDIVDSLVELARRKSLDISKLLLAIQEEKNTPHRQDIRWEKDVLYLNSKKDLFLEYGSLLPLRNLLKSVYGEPVKKFGQRMYRLEVK